MHVAIAFRWPKKMLSVTKEMQVVVHVDPTGISLCKYTCCLPGLAIGEIQRQLGLKSRHGFQTQAATIRQPFRADDVFKWFVGYLDPGRVGLTQFGYSETHARI